MKVELHLAYFWNCDDCGAENFCRSMVAAMTPELRAEMAECDIDVDEMEPGNWMTRPDKVTCSACGATFEATDPYGDDEEDET